MCFSGFHFGSNKKYLRPILKGHFHRQKNSREQGWADSLSCEAGVNITILLLGKWSLEKRNKLIKKTNLVWGVSKRKDFNSILLTLMTVINHSGLFSICYISHGFIQYKKNHSVDLYFLNISSKLLFSILY